MENYCISNYCISSLKANMKTVLFLIFYTLKDDANEHVFYGEGASHNIVVTKQ